MFCPKCGTQNDDEPRFCRGCGENLKVISQAMSIGLPALLVRKMDAYIERKYRRLRTEGIGSLVCGGIFIFLGCYDVIAGASWTSEWFNVAFGTFMLLIGLWDSIVYKRSLSTDVRIIKMGGAASTNELPPLNATHIVETPASIAESTTGHLDAVPRRQQKS